MQILLFVSLFSCWIFILKGRLAPSPTGAQHLGNARSFLIAFWSARSQGGKLALRIEDFDSPRVKSWATEQAITDLGWLGIDWDGPPMIQTERLEIYQSYLQQLVESNRAYPCTCSRKDIAAAASAPHEQRSTTQNFFGEGGDEIVYPGTCASWNPGDPIPEVGSFCWRFRTGDQEIKFDDKVVGQQRCIPSAALGDFPLTQKNGKPSYQLVVVVDDALTGVTEVVRGDDLVASTFRQIEIYQAFEFEIPTFAHVPLVTGTDGRRLAKRHGDTRLSYFRDQGVKPESIVGWAAHSAGLTDKNDPIHASELIDPFDWNKINRERVVVDEAIINDWVG